MEFWIGAVVGLGVNFYSLYLPAKKKVKKIISNPAFVLGDLVLVPLYIGLAALFLKANFTNLTFWPLLLAVPLVYFYGRQFKLAKNEWLLHGLVACFLVGVLLLSLPFPPWPLPFAIILLANQLLGIATPKKFKR